MSKETKKEKPSYNLEIINALHDKNGFSKYYIRKSISGNVQGITPDKIKKDYRKLEREITTKIEQFKNQ